MSSTQSSPSSSSTALSSFTGTTTSSHSLTPAVPSSFPPPSSQTAGSQANGNPNGDGSIATSASLYLYTFLATLVLLLSVSAAIVIRSFVLRRRHRLMVEEAIRNGTWVPPAPPTRPPKVDLSKKPVLWEAYIDKNGDLVGHAVNGSAGGITDVWKMENMKDWDMIKPIAATYVPANEASITPPLPGKPPPSTGLPTTPSVGSLRGASALQPTGQNSGSPDLEAGNVATAPTTPAPAPRSRIPQPRAILSRALRMLNPTPDPTSPLPASLGSNQNTGSNANLVANAGPEGAMGELKSPQVMRVAVFIAMPKPPSAEPHSHPHSHSSSSASHPLQPSTSSSYHPPHLDDDDEQPLPHLEMGVADVLVVPPESAESPVRSGKKAQRGSLGSMATEASDM